MAQIVLSDDQLEVVRSATDVVAIRDGQGKLVGTVSPPPTEQEILEARRRLNSDGPWYTTQQVIDHLNSLEQK